MNTADLSTAIKDDLYNELRWLLCAATQWYVCGQHATSSQLVPHTKVYSMDSVFLHARSLYEFFTNPRVRSDRLSWNDYGLAAAMQSTVYSQLISDLHGRGLHLNKDRSSYASIKNEVVNIAQDILLLWDNFSADSTTQVFKVELDEARKLSIQDANKISAQYNVNSLFS